MILTDPVAIVKLLNLNAPLSMFDNGIMQLRTNWQYVEKSETVFIIKQVVVEYKTDDKQVAACSDRLIHFLYLRLE